MTQTFDLLSLELVEFRAQIVVHKVEMGGDAARLDVLGRGVLDALLELGIGLEHAHHLLQVLVVFEREYRIVLDCLIHVVVHVRVEFVLFRGLGLLGILVDGRTNDQAGE